MIVLLLKIIAGINKTRGDGWRDYIELTVQ